MATENPSRIVSDFETQLSGAISAGDSSFTLQSVVDVDGNTLSDGIYCFTLDRDNSNAKEYLLGQLTTATKTVSSVSSISRQGVATANAQRSHRIGANIIISDHSILAALSRIFTGLGTINPSAPLEYTTDPTLSSSTQLATKGYVDSVVSGGTVNANKIILGSQTAGETIVAGNIIYFKAADQRWWKADADDTTTFAGVTVGVAQGSGTAGNAITNGVLIYGKADNFSGLTPGSKYYLSNTAGGVSTSVGTNTLALGIAEDADTIFFNPNIYGVQGAPTAFVSTSAGVADAGKGVVLDGNGKFDASFTNLPTRKVFIKRTFGSATTQFDITKTGDTVRYTYDATGTDPAINSTTVPVGAVLTINGENFTAGNNGTFTVTAVGTNYFEVTNSSGVAENDKTLGTGSIIGATTWTKPTGLKYVDIEAVGAGGGGGSVTGSDVVATGGGSGGYARRRMLASLLGATETVTVPLPAVANANGGNTTFGSHITCNGGTAGQEGDVSGSGGTATGGDLNFTGGGGHQGSFAGASNQDAYASGNGADSMLGQGGKGAKANEVGGDASGWGAGGGGACTNGTTDFVGGASSGGVVIIDEYYN